MKYQFTHWLLAAALLCGVSGCIKEDRSECNPGVLLKYDYSLNTERENLFGQEVNKVTVYVFDEKGLYCGCYSDEGSHLTNDYVMTLPLPAGKYTAVVWGGELETYRIGEMDADGSTFHGELTKGVTRIDDFALVAEKEGQPLEDIDHLFHGRKEVVSVYQASSPSTVYLTKDTQHLSVKIKDVRLDGGDDAAARSEEMPYEVYATGTNGRYRADNTFAPGSQTVYITPYREEVNDGEMTADLTLLRLVPGRENHVVVKTRSGKTVFDRDLVKFMQEKAGFDSLEDFDREDEYEVVVNMDKDVAVSVTINGWEAIDIVPDL